MSGQEGRQRLSTTRGDSSATAHTSYEASGGCIRVVVAEAAREQTDLVSGGVGLCAMNEIRPGYVRVALAECARTWLHHTIRR